jgi:hypothetical protein
MISTSRQRRTSTVPSKHDYDRLASKVDSCNINKSCNYANEIFLLKDLVSSLQAGFLLLKGNLVASDRLRSGQMDYVKAYMKQI